MKLPVWPPIAGKGRNIELGLNRVYALLEALGSPHKKLPPVVHVAGTNGKGSVIAFLRAMLEESDKKIHVYTSPHLVDFNERIVLAGECITDVFLDSVLAECKEAAENNGISITFFEGITVAAFLAFSRVEADILLLETGLGGRLDATNVVESPLLTVITPISRDHMEYLGNTIEEIASEKAGILKKSTPCVVGYQDDISLDVIKNTILDLIGDDCENVKDGFGLGALLFGYGERWQCNITPDGFCYHSEFQEIYINDNDVGLKGRHQYYNAAHAIACMEGLARKSHVVLSESSIRSGIKNVYWPARMQNLTDGVIYNSLPEGVELWLDGGHNEAAGVAIAERLGQWQSEGGKTYIIAGMVAGKDVESFLRKIIPFAAGVCVVSVGNVDFGLSASDVGVIAKSADIDVIEADNVMDACGLLLSCGQIEECGEESVGGENKVRIFICGSLYLAGEVLSMR